MTKQIDIAGLRDVLEALLDYGKKDDAVTMMMSVVTQLKEDNDRLTVRLARLLKHRFGRRSERIPIEQLKLFLDEPELAVVPAADQIEVPAHVRKKSGHGRRALPANLPRELVPLEPSAEEKVCALCGSQKQCMGHDTSEVLELEPARFKVLVYQRAKYACQPCGGEVVIGPTGDRPIESGLPGYGLLCDVLVRKFTEHMPLNRLRESYRRLGVDLPISTLADWVATGSDLLDPLAHAIWARSLLAHILQTDDTGMTVIDDKHSGGSKRGHVWCYLGDKRWASYVYTPTWSGDGPCEFLQDRVGWVQADAYRGYDALFSAPDARAIEVGCWAHTRRGFVNALERDKRAAIAVKLIRDLYAIEHDATERGLDAEGRKALRADRAPPILADLVKWMKSMGPSVLPKSDLGKAITYATNQWTALTRFLEDGALELDNNACERALRPIAVGRKNWLFAGSDDGAVRAATIFTVLGTCRVNGVEPVAYLKDVMKKLMSGWPQSKIEELLPPRWKEINQPDLSSSSAIA